MFANGGSPLMAMILKLDYQLLAQDLCDELAKGADEAMQHFLNVVAP